MDSEQFCFPPPPPAKRIAKNMAMGKVNFIFKLSTSNKALLQDYCPIKLYFSQENLGFKYQLLNFDIKSARAMLSVRPEER